MGDEFVYEVIGKQAGEWFLRLPWEESELDVWAYTRCQPVEDPSPVPLVVDQDGERVEFSFGSFNIPIASSRLFAPLGK